MNGEKKSLENLISSKIEYFDGHDLNIKSFFFGFELGLVKLARLHVCMIALWTMNVNVFICSSRESLFDPVSLVVQILDATFDESW